MNSDGKSGPGPCYVALPSFKNLLTQFKEQGVPGQVDRSVMHSFSGGTQSHLVSSLRFLRLIDSESVPTAALRPLADAVGTEEWGESLRPVIETAYSEVMGDLKIASATPAQIEGKFRAAGLDGSTLDKAMRFYVQALREADVPHSPHLARRRKSTGPKRPSQRRQSDDRGAVVNGSANGGAAEHRNDGKREESHTQAGMISFPVFIKNKTTGTVSVPNTITADECAMLDLAVQMVKAYAAQNSTAT